MFKKLSAALVAMSLVAVAQPASAQATFQITIKKFDGFSVIATTDKGYVPYEVTVDGVKIKMSASELSMNLKPGMVCDITQKPYWSTYNNYISCKSV